MKKATKATTEQVAGLDLATGESKTVLVYRATKPLTQAQFELAASMLKREHSKAGVAVLVIPFSVELQEVNGNADSDATGTEDKEVKDDADSGKTGTEDNE